MMTAYEHAAEAAEGDLSSRVLDRLTSQLGSQAKVQAIFGEPVERDGITVIPVARVRWGVGGGGGAGPEGSGSGGGGGVYAEPVGYVEMTSAGAVFRPMPRSMGAAQIVAVAVAAAIVLRAVARFRR
jgi:uncharacterized spore protein YtfJ